MSGDDLTDLKNQLTILMSDKARLGRDLERTAHQLASEIAQRKRLESELRTISEQFGLKVQERTSELTAERDSIARTAVLAILEASGSSRVLLVEDNEINRIVALSLLEELHIQAEWAGNGQEALSKLAAAPFDLVLMDLQMPVMDGLSATRAIRSDPRWRSLPVIAMSANATVEDRADCLTAGMNGFLAKPVEPAQLWITLASFLAPKIRVTTEPGSKAARQAGVSSALDGSASAPLGSVSPPLQPGFSDRSQEVPASAIRSPSSAGSGSWSSSGGAFPGSTGFDAGAKAGVSPGGQDSFPDAIEGVDVADGLGRLLGNRKAYFSLLRKFVDRGRGSAATIRSALAASDIESAIREAHSVKGVAAGLGIKGIAAQAASVEAAIRRKDGPEALEPAIAEYERLLATVLAAIAAGLALA